MKDELNIQVNDSIKIVDTGIALDERWAIKFTSWILDAYIMTQLYKPLAYISEQMITHYIKRSLVKSSIRPFVKVQYFEIRTRAMRFSDESIIVDGQELKKIFQAASDGKNMVVVRGGIIDPTTVTLSCPATKFMDMLEEDWNLETRSAWDELRPAVYNDEPIVDQYLEFRRDLKSSESMNQNYQLAEARNNSGDSDDEEDDRENDYSEYNETEE